MFKYLRPNPEMSNKKNPDLYRGLYFGPKTISPPPFLKMIFFPFGDCCFSDSIVALLQKFLTILHLFYPFTSPFFFSSSSIFFPLLPFSFPFLPFSFPFLPFSFTCYLFFFSIFIFFPPNDFS